MPQSANTVREDRAIALFFVACVLFNLAMVSIGWTHAISDVHGWRQAQTAITAYFMQQGGPWLRYETPVLGPPWRVPHEFPVYQAVIVTLARATGLSLESAGRATSVGFFYLSLVAAFVVLWEMGVSARRRLLVIGLLLLSPVYIFWSRTFMVESTALCFCLAYLALVLRYLSRGHYAYAAAAVVAGSLGAAVKPITVVPVVFLAGCAWLARLREPERGWLSTHLLAGSLVVVAPLGGGWLWQHYADGLKGLDTNSLAWGIASRQLSQDWILGPPGSWAGPDVRFQAAAWRLLWLRNIPETLGHPAVALAALIGILVAARRRTQFFLAAAAFVLHFALFLPLHLAHPYYRYAMGCFAVAALGIASVALLECPDGRRHLAWLLVALYEVLAVGTYRTTLLPQQQRDAYRKPAWFIRLARDLGAMTRPDEIIVGFGMNWNPEVPYYARRRALMWPDWGDLRPDGKDVPNAIANLRRYTVGAVFSCTHDIPEETLELFRKLGQIGEASRREYAGAFHASCTVYTRRALP